MEASYTCSLRSCIHSLHTTPTTPSSFLPCFVHSSSFCTFQQCTSNMAWKVFFLNTFNKSSPWSLYISSMRLRFISIKTSFNNGSFRFPFPLSSYYFIIYSSINLAVTKVVSSGKYILFWSSLHFSMRSLYQLFDPCLHLVSRVLTPNCCSKSTFLKPNDCLTRTFHNPSTIASHLGCTSCTSIDPTPKLACLYTFHCETPLYFLLFLASGFISYSLFFNFRSLFLSLFLTFMILLAFQVPSFN